MAKTLELIGGHTREEHLDMMQHPEKWPHLGILPLTGPDPDGDNLGVILEGKGPVVYITPRSMYLVVDWNACPKIEFPSFEALLDSGWVVD